MKKPEQYLLTGLPDRKWYDKAGRVLRELGRLIGQPFPRVVDVFALTSPRTRVGRNLTVTVQYLKDGTLPADVIRSTRVALDHYEQTGVIRGPKTGRFAAALKGDRSAVVVDTHMLRAYGFPEHPQRRVHTRKRITRSVERLADKYSLSPRDCQAAIWCGYLSPDPPVLQLSDLERLTSSVPYIHPGVLQQPQ